MTDGVKLSSATPWPLFASYAGLLSLATLSIYAGAYSTLRPRPRFKRRTSGQSQEQDSDEEEEELLERLSAQDAYFFPIIGSVMLGGLYLVFKYLGKEWINFLFGIYFSIIGVGSVWKTSVALFRSIIGSEKWESYDKFKLTLHRGHNKLFRLVMPTPSILLWLPAIIPSALYSLTPKNTPKPALLTNILALSFTHTALNLLRIDGFKSGTILLAGLFLYDIWWVFGTEVMVKVATSFDAPIKILWPKSLDFASARGFTMLGLGDIVIPGTFITLALRYDQHLSKTLGTTNFPKPYFTATLTAYFIGLVTTMTVMHVFGRAQPALLYLSPACILSFVATAFSRGEFTKAWTWTDEPTDSKKENETSSDQPTTEGASTGVAPLNPYRTSNGMTYRN